MGDATVEGKERWEAGAKADAKVGRAAVEVNY